MTGAYEVGYAILMALQGRRQDQSRDFASLEEYKDPSSCTVRSRYRSSDNTLPSSYSSKRALAPQRTATDFRIPTRAPPPVRLNSISCPSINGHSQPFTPPSTCPAASLLPSLPSSSPSLSSPAVRAATAAVVMSPAGALSCKPQGRR